MRTDLWYDRRGAGYVHWLESRFANILIDNGITFRYEVEYPVGGGKSRAIDFVFAKPVKFFCVDAPSRYVEIKNIPSEGKHAQKDMKERMITQHGELASAHYHTLILNKENVEWLEKWGINGKKTSEKFPYEIIRFSSHHQCEWCREYNANPKNQVRKIHKGRLKPKEKRGRALLRTLIKNATF